MITVRHVIDHRVSLINAVHAADVVVQDVVVLLLLLLPWYESQPAIM
jgi:hypothetical protein